MQLLKVVWANVFWAATNNSNSSSNDVRNEAHAADKDSSYYVTEAKCQGRMRIVNRPVQPALIKYFESDQYHHTVALHYSQKTIQDDCMEKVKIPKSELPATKQTAINLTQREYPINGMYPLSLFDPKVPKDWNGQMSISVTSNSITYRTPTGGLLTLAFSDSVIEVSELKDMLVSNITPGDIVANLKVGDKIQITEQTDAFLWVNNSVDQDYFAVAQDNIYFYKQGFRDAGVNLNPHGVFTAYAMDIVRIGATPQWQVNYEPKPYFPKIFYPTVSEALFDDFWEIVRFIQLKILKEPCFPISETNRFIEARGFLPESVISNQGILEYVNAIAKLDDITMPMGVSNQATPLFASMLTVATTGLLAMDTTIHNDILFSAQFASFVDWNMILDNTNYATIKMIAFAITSIVDLSKDLDCEKIQNLARTNIDFATGVYLYFNNFYPYCEWVWKVTPAVSLRYPLQKDAHILMDNYKNYRFDSLKPIIQEHFNSAISMLPNVLLRARSNVKKDDLSIWTLSSLNSFVANVDASLLPSKALFTAKNNDPIYMGGLFRYCNELSNATLTTSPGKFLSQSFGLSGWSFRLNFAKSFTYRLLVNPADENLASMLGWMPPYLSAYVAENLDLLHVPHNIPSRGKNQFAQDPVTKEGTQLQKWIQYTWPSGRPLKVSSYLGAGGYWGQYSTVDISYQTLNLGGFTCLTFNTPWEGLDCSDLSTVFQKGKNSWAVQTQPDSTMDIYLGKCNTSRLVFFIRPSSKLVKILNGGDDTSAKTTPWSANISVSAGDFILILDDPYKVDAQTIATTIAGLVEPESIKYALSTFQLKVADTLYAVSDS